MSILLREITTFEFCRKVLSSAGQFCSNRRKDAVWESYDQRNAREERRGERLVGKGTMLAETVIGSERPTLPGIRLDDYVSGRQ
jgi:hypothetical protein